MSRHAERQDKTLRAYPQGGLYVIEIPQNLFAAIFSENRLGLTGHSALHTIGDRTGIDRSIAR